MIENCTFFTKIGACRHGEKCSRRHVKPTSSHTLLLSNLYENPKLNKNNDDELNPKEVQQQFDEFYRDIFIKFALLGQVRDIVVCENENNHLNGNVYVRYEDPDMAMFATLTLNQEWFNNRPVHCELSPVESFQEANCRAYDTNSCLRDFCNFMHVRRPSPQVRLELYKAQEKSKLEHDLKRWKLEKEVANAPKEAPSLPKVPVQPEASVDSVVQQLFA